MPVQKHRVNLKYQNNHNKTKISKLWGERNLRITCLTICKSLFCCDLLDLLNFPDVCARSGKLGLGEGCSLEMGDPIGESACRGGIVLHKLIV